MEYDGRLCFYRCLSVNTGQVLTGGVPQPDADGGVPHDGGWWIPRPGQDRVGYPMMGYPLGIGQHMEYL